MEKNNEQEKSARRWKYSDMMHWWHEMHREVGLNIPPMKVPKQTAAGADIEVTFIRRKPTTSRRSVILHIPHSSTHLPSLEGFVVDEQFLEQEMLKLTDWYTDDLFYLEGELQVVAQFSRVFCDPERFTDDALEPMAKYGRGVIYVTADNGQVMREVSPDLRESILADYYRKHHERLSQAVDEQLKEYGKALILDCHSFPDRPFLRDLDQTPQRPDFNIGTDPYHTSRELVDFSVAFFEQAGYSLGIDWPYRGSIVPLEQYGKNKNVQSIMLEVNRALYLREFGNEKSERYPEIRRVIGEYIRGIKKLMIGN